mmetsp:Transcript_28127/g.64369  ORF Transcript_28127/g.64369 Transcript_28127/m.64369 type:complete len:202 (-) Transcript_28127:80-685(-)|eukprot:CAMPEP_0113303738 /NCGR_PEP_ID=MMETSP0010_2-20120614/4030_1 /TAXON_ID=216773 ORGANISM="Corethron hystrix, Strain 308" /NCGR_SAMPLE_ID=MMETSP0010_2 /ASSEMBLY_ACC=CAM_ASM_000155 /LENGTH=201 /DNA_ID=CAMNT_0000157787 /DNA_START=229 /DNA_END=834 /DNA_ORIENTATION=+ /assembly_acc=CAM_ASM_000155
MDSVFALRYDGGVIIAADQANARSILVYQNNLDKIIPLSSHTMMGMSGPNSDLVNFSDFIRANVKLYELMNNGATLTTDAQANFVRGTLATALRKGPYQVNLLLGGFDVADKKAGLYYMDYMASMHPVNFGVQGYASNFCLSIFDRDWKEGLTQEEGVKIVEKCINELQTRFLVAQPNFIIKVVDEKGVRTLSFGEDPADV